MQKFNRRPGIFTAIPSSFGMIRYAELTHTIETIGESYFPTGTPIMHLQNIKILISHNRLCSFYETQSNVKQKTSQEKLVLRVAEKIHMIESIRTFSFCMFLLDRSQFIQLIWLPIEDYISYTRR
jgi:hypothetical protein